MGAPLHLVLPAVVVLMAVAALSLSFILESKISARGVAILRAAAVIDLLLALGLYLYLLPR